MAVETSMRAAAILACKFVIRPEKVGAEVERIRAEAGGEAIHGRGRRVGAGRPAVLHPHQHELRDLAQTRAREGSEVLHDAEAGVLSVADGLGAHSFEGRIARGMEARQGGRSVFNNDLARRLQLVDMRVHALDNVLHVLHVGDAEGAEAEEVHPAKLTRTCAAAACVSAPAPPPHAPRTRSLREQTWWTGGARTRRSGTRRAGVRAGVRAGLRAGARALMHAILGSAGAREGDEDA